MKIIDIAIKDLTRSFRSAFAVIFMFGVPLLVTGMFYFMFGGMDSGEESINLPATRVVIANLDEGISDFKSTTAQFPAEVQASSLGEMIVNVLQSPDFSGLITATLATDAQAAYAAVDTQQAGVAIVISADFTARFMTANGQATLTLYNDPTLSLGPAIVQSILGEFVDNISGAQIAMQVAAQASGKSDPQTIGQVMQAYMANRPQGEAAASMINVQSPTTEDRPAGMLLTILGPIMGGMMIFYAFYTGTTAAQTILKEEEERTLPRLFTTPTPQAQILVGKFLAVFLTVLVQVVVLLAAARLIFNIDWGSFPDVALMAGGAIIAASSFGIFINSLLKDTKQGGIVYGGILTLTGMIGMLSIFTSFAGGANWADTVSLIAPQGWAMRAIFQSMNAAPLGDITLTSLAMLAWSAVFLSIGVWRFQHRYI
jgi:ABC-type Na+ efflux pump permease subunit